MEQLRAIFKEILHEELAPITGKLDGLEERFDGLDNRMGALEERFDGLDNRMGALEERFDGVKHRMDRLENQMSGIQLQLDRMEHTQSEDLMSMLLLIDKKVTFRMEHHEHQIEVINTRLLGVEADVHKLLSPQK